MTTVTDCQQTLNAVECQNLAVSSGSEIAKKGSCDSRASILQWTALQSIWMNMLVS